MDIELRHQILRAATRDRLFLKAVQHDIHAEDFSEREEQVVAKASLQFYEKHAEPIGSLLRTYAEDIAIQDKLGSDAKKKLKELLDLILGTKMEMVSVKALEERCKALHAQTFYESAVEEIIEAQDKGNLSTQTIADLLDRAQKELRNGIPVAGDYFATLDERQARRQKKDDSYPLLLIDPLDEKIRALGRGHFGIFVGPWNSGKGLALIHVAMAYALQGLNVLHITLEDPKDIVEDRFDAAITGMPINKLAKLPRTFRKRWKRLRKHMRGKIHIIDGTDSEWSVSSVEKAWEQERQNGFIADAIIVDYDDELVSEKQFKGESARRMEFADIYRKLRKLAAKLNIYLWSAAQTNRPGEGKKIITGKLIGEDVSKARKAFLAIGIGGAVEEQGKKHLFVMRHKTDRSRFGVDICTNFESAIFYDRDATLAMRKALRHRAV